MSETAAPAPDERPVIFVDWLRSAFPTRPDWEITERWKRTPEGERAFWRRLAQLDGGITELLDGITTSANATRPSRKTALEDEFAIALRKLLEPS